MTRSNCLVPAVRAGGRPAVESLEGRTLFAAMPAVAMAVVVDGLLDVWGTQNADEIALSVNAGDGNLIDVTAGVTLLGSFDKSLLSSIRVVAGDGNDSVLLDAGVTLACRLLGGSGDDTLVGGDAADVLIGGRGLDILTGALGDDHLLGGDGRDLLEGGLGDDILEGMRGFDALTGGGGNDIFRGRDTLLELQDFVDGLDVKARSVADEVKGFFQRLFDWLF
jgi:Ca2+-binding RTX toxin-like protein